MTAVPAAAAPGAPLTRPLRVCAVLPAGVLGGAERWLMAALDSTDRWDLDVVLLQDGPVREELERRGVPVRLLPVGRTGGAVARAVPRLAALLRTTPPDVVLANGVKAAVVAAPAGLLAAVHVVWVKHDHSFDRAAPLLGRLCSQVVATAEEVAEPVRRPGTAVVTPPRPAAPLPREGARAAWARRGLLLDDRPTMIALGRRVPYKGIDDAVRALALPGGQGWRLVVVGDDDPSAPGCGADLLRLAGSLGVAERVELREAVPDAAGLLAAFDALVVLTKPTGAARTPDREGFGMTALEAMLAGVPVVAVAGGPVVRRLAGRAGLAVGPGDPAAVAAALHQLTDPRLRARLGAAGRELAAGHPDAAQTAERLVGVLARVAGRPGAGLRSGPDLTVVVPVRDDAPALDLLLRRLAPQLRTGDRVLVVDGGSTDGSVDVVSRWGRRDRRIELLEAPGSNIPQARNLAWSRVRTPWVAATDAGCLPEAGWLDALRAAAADGAQLVTGVYRVASRDAFQAAVAAACYPDPDEVRRPALLVRAYTAALGRSFDPTLPTNRSNAVQVGAAVAVGGFDPRLATAEDVSFGQALVRAGHRAVLSVDAEVAWEQRPTVRATARMYRAYGEGDGRSGERTLVARDLARLGAYLAGPLLLARGGAARQAALIGAAGYLSLPWHRAVRHPQPVRTAALVPVALAVKDLAKAFGCLQGLRRGRDSP